MPPAHLRPNGIASGSIPAHRKHAQPTFGPAEAPQAHYRIIGSSLGQLPTQKKRTRPTFGSLEATPVHIRPCGSDPNPFAADCKCLRLTGSGSSPIPSLVWPIRSVMTNFRPTGSASGRPEVVPAHFRPTEVPPAHLQPTGGDSSPLPSHRKQPQNTSGPQEVTPHPFRPNKSHPDPFLANRKCLCLTRSGSGPQEAPPAHRKRPRHTSGPPKATPNHIQPIRSNPDPFPAHQK